MPDTPEERLERRARQVIEGKQAMIDYKSSSRATVENLARLRSERAAREAAAAIPVPQEKSIATSSRKKKKT